MHACMVAWMVCSLVGQFWNSVAYLLCPASCTTPMQLNGMAWYGTVQTLYSIRIYRRELQLQHPSAKWRCHEARPMKERARQPRLWMHDRAALRFRRCTTTFISLRLQQPCVPRQQVRSAHRRPLHVDYYPPLHPKLDMRERAQCYVRYLVYQRHDHWTGYESNEVESNGNGMACGPLNNVTTGQT